MLSNPCPICREGTLAGSRCPIAADWGDGERMSFLTSHVSLEDLSDHQSHAREQIVEFWSKALGHAFECSSGLSLDLEAVVKGPLAWYGAVAPGLELAVRSMTSSGKLVYREEIEAEKGLARQLVETPLVYLFSMLRLDGRKRNVPTGQYVHKGVLESVADQLVQHCQNLPEEERTVYLNAAPQHGDALGQAVQQQQTMPPWSFQQLCAAAATHPGAHGRKCDPASGNSGISTPSNVSALLSKLSGDDLELLAQHLVRTKHAVKDTDGDVLKVLARGGAGSSAGRGAGTAGSISEMDKDLLRLRCTVSSLQANTSSLEQRVSELRQDALKANKEGQKRTALVHMRRMKQCQAARDNRLSTLYTLEGALGQVNRLRVDKQVLEAHEAATKALKSCREKHGLTVERVENTLDALAEEMADTQAIGSALAQGNEVLRDPDEEAELEKELKDLLQENNNVAGTPTPVVVASATDSGPGGQEIVARPQPEPVTDRTEAARGPGVLGNEGGKSDAETRRPAMVPA